MATTNYTTDDKRKDLIFIDRQRIERTYSNNFFMMIEKLNASEESFNNMSAQKINQLWSEWKNPTILTEAELSHLDA